MLLAVSSVATVSLMAGAMVGRLVIGGDDAASEPEAVSDTTAITAAVEERTLESTVVIRGDAAFAGAVDVAPQVAGLTEPPIVTGRVPDVGDEIREAEPILEIVGRPVIVLEGELPMYRTLRPGVSGPDVRQLEEALDRLGLDAGTVNENYTGATARAVRNLYDEAGGYAPPEASEQAQAAAAAADAEVKAREDQVEAARRSLARASKGPSESEKLSAQQAVDAAKRTLDNAREAGDENAIAQAEDQLELAILNRDELLEDPDTSAEQAALDDALVNLAEAQRARDEARAAANTPLPASEVVFLESLPRRVDDVAVERGDEVSGTAVTVSGADIVIDATVDDNLRGRLAEEMPVLIDLPAGEQIEGEIMDIEPVDGPDLSGYVVRIAPPDLDSDQASAVRGANVRLTIPITNTGGDVLAVPLAALTAGPDGESYVEVAAADGTTRRVQVEVGITAQGFAEVAPADGDETLAPGDHVVVGE